MCRLVQLIILLFPVCASCAVEHTPSWPLWDGRESVEQYAKRTNLPPAKTLDLGNGVNLEVVLIPAGKFIMGTPEPKPVDEVGFARNIIVFIILFATSGFGLLGFVYVIVGRARLLRRPIQYSLGQLMAMMLALAMMLGGAIHWWLTEQVHGAARREYSAAWDRYSISDDDERPAHEVTLTRPFYMAKFLTTQEQYQQVMTRNPSNFKGANLPVERVSWDDAQEFCKKVSERTAGVSPAQTGAGGTPAVRLPTEAEWEFACRAGTTTTYYTGDAETDLGRAAWYDANSGGTTHPVGQKDPNAFGLHDMHGNVLEWVQDYYAGKYYADSPPIDPKSPASGGVRVLRGGGLVYDPYNCRAARRGYGDPDGPDTYCGFRCALDF